MHLSGVREALFGLALAFQAQGRTHDADDALRRSVETVIDAAALEHLPSVQGFEARLALLRGQSDLAIRWLSAADVSIESNTLHASDHALMTKVKTLIAIGSVEHAGRSRNGHCGASRPAETAHFEGRLVEIRALAALVREAQGRTADVEVAMTAIARGRAEAAAYLRTYLDSDRRSIEFSRCASSRARKNRRLETLLNRAGTATTAPEAA